MKIPGPSFGPKPRTKSWPASLVTRSARPPLTYDTNHWDRRLERNGLFRSEVIGRQKYFQLNREYPLFDEVRKIVAKTIGAAPVIAQSLKTGYSGEGEHRFRREAERHSGAKVNSSRSAATLAW